jgi:ribosomal protein S18 acetylase RimI-like enzyme
MTSPPTSVVLASTDADLRAILELQQQNLESSLSREAVQSQGFLTVVHSLDTLRAMQAKLPSVVAKRGDLLVGYALAMHEETRELIPVLDPMFQLFQGLSFRGAPLSGSRFYVMGQICVAPSARGQGVFDALYLGHRAHYASQFDLTVTEVATRNTRSMRAHQRVGFETIHRFRDVTDDWTVVAWDFRASASVIGS